MLGLKKRNKVEGWALDVSHPELDGKGRSIRQRLADNDKLWLGSLILILLIVAVTVYTAKKHSGGEPIPVESELTAIGTYGDAAHAEFAEQFAASGPHRDIVLSAAFVGPSKFRVTVRADVSTDDITEMAQYAGNKILNEFRTRAVIQVYALSAATGEERLAATARFVDEEYGFVVEFQDRGVNAADPRESVAA